MRIIVVIGIALAPAGCASDPRYNPRTFDTASSANPIDRGTEMLRQIRHAEMERDKQRAGETKKTPRLFKSQEDHEDEET